MSEFWDNLLNLLRDGEWHRISEITTKIDVSESALQQVGWFLQKYGLASVRTQGLLSSTITRIKLGSEAYLFLNAKPKVEAYPAVRVEEEKTNESM